MNTSWLNRKLEPEEWQLEPEDGCYAFRLKPEESMWGREIIISTDNVLGHIHINVDRLKRLIEEMEEGDELWLFDSPKDYWRMLAGRAGVCIVRDGKIVKTALTSMS